MLTGKQKWQRFKGGKKLNMEKENKCTIASCKGDCIIKPRRVEIPGDYEWEFEVCDEKGIQTYARKNEYKLPPVKIIPVKYSVDEYMKKK